jgi:hypothetical protein
MLRFVVVLFSIQVHVLFAQIGEQNRELILKVLLSEAVEPYVFFDYENCIWRGPYQLGGGRYAFICPDSTFQNIYPGIIDEFPYSIETDGLLELKKIYSDDSSRGVYARRIISSGVLYIIFTEIKIDSNLAEIDLYTTSLFDRASFKGHYFQVKSRLCIRKGKWKVESIDVKSIDWRKTFEPLYLSKPKH